MDTAVAAASVGLQEDVMNALATLWRGIFLYAHLTTLISICSSRRESLSPLRHGLCP